MKNSHFVAVALVLVILFFSLSHPTPLKEIRLIFASGQDNIMLDVKISDTDEARSRGLMFVEKLSENEGMLFVFPGEQKRTFWMKNTLIPLDMIFIAANGTVVDVVEDAQPCKEEPCEVYPADAPARYAVEVNAGFSKRHGLATGSRMAMP